MTNKKQPCNRRTCPNYKSAQASNETQTTSLHSCLSESEMFNESANAEGCPDEVEESSSQMTLLQRIRDPHQFMLTLQNIVDLAENLLAAIEDAIEGVANKLRRSLSSVMSRKVDKIPETRSAYSDEDIRIIVSVPLTFHIRPRVASDWVLSEPIDEDMREPIEPIRTASISMGPGPRSMYFADDDQMGDKEPEPEGRASSGTLQEFPLPQQKDLSLCAPCDCKRCPEYDDNHAVVCPQSCGCCSCPWRGNTDTNLCHREVKICGCTSSAKRCECLPNFDICACRDIAESRHVELYGTDMYADGLLKDRYGATQNDRHGDHSNLSNQPNIEASAGPRQQPAGPKETQQAKDDEKNERSSTDQYYTPRSSFLSSREQTSECCDESPSPTLVQPRNGSALICFSRKFNDSLEEQVSVPPKYVFSEEYWAPKDSFQQQQQPAEGGDDENVLQRSEQQKREKIDNCIQSLYGLHFIGRSPSFTRIASSARNHSSSENVESNRQKKIPSNSSDEPIFYTPRESSANALRTSSDINQGDSMFESGITLPESKDSRLLQLLESIYELLQCMREDYRQRRGETVESLSDLPPPPPPPPSSPSIGQQIQIASAPPFNIFISPKAIEQEEQSACLDPSQYTVETQGMELLDPPERDVDPDDQQPRAGTQRLIPVDVDLLDLDYCFDLEGGKEDVVDSGPRNEVQVKIENLPLVEDMDDPISNGVSYSPLRNSNPFECQELETVALTCCPTSSIQPASQFDVVPHESKKICPSQKTGAELCECVCEDSKECADTCCKFLRSYHSNSIESPGDHQSPSQFKRDSGTSQEIQVNTDSLQSVALPNAIHPAPVATTANIDTERLLLGEEDPGSDAHICHCRQATAEPQKPNASDFIDSIICDLKAMKKVREKACRRPFKTGSQTHATDSSFPVTIETVRKLGPNSLFIKWKVHNCANIAGYEIYLDGRLTYRYFSRVHRAAVIYNVNLQYPHIIILRAQSHIQTQPPSFTCNSKPLTSATTNTEYRTNAAACYPQPDGSVWYPSVFHFEPNFLISTS